MDVLIFGAGYVGLSTAAVLSQVHNVTVVELREDIIKSINSGKQPLREDGLELLIEENVRNGRLKAISQLNAIEQQDAIMICVNTPSLDDGSADLGQVNTVLNTIEDHLDELLRDYLLIALRSTVPPGTTRSMILSRFTNTFDNIGVVFSPEFLRQGSAVYDITKPDRVVIGGSSRKAMEMYEQIVRPCIIVDDTPFHMMSIESAEMCKYVSNCFLATKISFANEIAALSEQVPDVDVDDVMKSVMADHRICPSHLQPGLGFGGSCFPKDIRALVNYASRSDVDMKILKSVLDVNASSSNRLVSLIHRTVPSISGKKIAILGLTFKAGTDDTRSSPTLDLIRQLKPLKADIHVHDPEANLDTVDSDTMKLFTFTSNLDNCVKGAELMILMTDWTIYNSIGLEKLIESMNQKVFIDGRRVFVSAQKPDGLIYRSLGSFQ
jgi:UDPglucose 6-dehydrogenase